MDAEAITIWFHKEHTGVFTLERVEERLQQMKPIVYSAFRPALPKFDKDISKLIESFRNIEMKAYLELVE